MTLHPNQTILGAVQLGTCADLNTTNPYEPEDKKRYLGWEEGHQRAIKEHQQQQKYNPSFFRSVLCKIGFHQYSLRRIPGRPHINPKTGNIDRRDPIIKKYTCVFCNDVYFIGLLAQKRSNQKHPPRTT